MNSSVSGWGPVRFVNTAMNLQDSVRREELTQTWRLLAPQGQLCSIHLVWRMCTFAFLYESYHIEQSVVTKLITLQQRFPKLRICATLLDTQNFANCHSLTIQLLYSSLRTYTNTIDIMQAVTFVNEVTCYSLYKQTLNRNHYKMPFRS